MLIRKPPRGAGGGKGGGSSPEGGGEHSRMPDIPHILHWITLLLLLPREYSLWNPPLLPPHKPDFPVSIKATVLRDNRLYNITNDSDVKL